jgi:hypothetical protein
VGGMAYQAQSPEFKPQYHTKRLFSEKKKSKDYDWLVYSSLMISDAVADKIWKIRIYRS